MIYIGDKKIKSCYLGDAPIGKVYLGDELLFAKPNLPEGYTEVEYIYFAASRNSAVKTNYVLTSGDIIQLTYEETSLATSRGAPFVGYALDTQRAEVYVSYSSSSVSGAKAGNPVGMMSWNVYTAFTSMVVTGEKVIYTISFPEKTLSAEFGGGAEKKQITTMANPASGANLHLLGDSDYNSISYCPVGRLYSCAVADSSGKKKANFVPCIDPSGTVGLYDTINENFCTKVDKTGVTSVLAAGPAV